MNWVGELVQKELSPTDTVLDLGCGTMQATLDTCPTYPATGIECKSIMGVDGYQPYLDVIKHKPKVKTLCANLTQPLPFLDKSFDVTLLLDVVEHLSLENAKNLLLEAERVTRKKIIVLTPKHFSTNMHNIANAYGLGMNSYQAHRCLFSKKLLRKIGFNPRHVKYKYVFAIKTFPQRILHIWDQAGVGALIAKTQRECGVVSHVVLLSDHDGLGISKFYDALLVPKQKLSMQYSSVGVLRGHRLVKRTQFSHILSPILHILRNIKFAVVVGRLAKSYDFLHIHSVYYLLPFLPNKPRLLHFHGDDVRQWLSKYRTTSLVYKLITKYWLRLFASKEYCLVSTPDILCDVPNSKWLPNPVDTKHFIHKAKYYNARALYIHNWYEDEGWAKTKASELGYDLTILHRDNNEHYPYVNMPTFLSGFTIFIDRHTIPSLSKTALEALAMGLKVVRWDGKLIKGLPKEHEPELVVKELGQHYIRVQYEK